MTYFDSALLKSNTANGKDWLQKYLHPPSAKGTSYNGYPDRSTSSVIHTEYRLNYENLPLATVQGPNNNACLFLCSPGLTTPIFSARNLSGDDPKWIPALENNQVTPKSVADNMGRLRTCYQSETFQYDATAFNNSGMCFSAQFNPSCYTLSLPQFVAKLVSQKSPHVHSFIKDLAINHGPDVSKQAQRYAADAANPDYDVLPDPRALPSSYNCVQVVKLNAPITSPGDITMLSPKSYTSRSVEGAFVVHQCNEDTNQFKTIRSAAVTSGTVSELKPLMYCAYEYRDPSGLTYIEPFFKTAAEGVGNYVLDVEWSDWSWSYTLFTGCQPDTGLNINIKYIAGFEVAPIVKSVLNSQAMPPALYDPTALETAAILTQSRQDAMPASMNSMGSFAAAVAPSLIHMGAGVLSGAISGADGSAAEKREMEKELAVSDSVAKVPLDVVNETARPSVPSSVPTLARGSNLSNRFGIMTTKRRRRNPPRAINTARGVRDMQREISKLRRSLSNMQIARPRNSRSNSRRRSVSRGRSNSRVRFNIGSRRR